ncbi:XrtA/PEP-CTERM system histidine kinase PrsK [Desulforhopalus sp. 52FAK]
MIIVFYGLNIVLFLSTFLHFRKKNDDGHLAISLVQALFFLPLLASEYLYFAYHFYYQTGELIFFSEAVFILIWLSLAKRLRQNLETPETAIKNNFLFEILSGSFFLILTGYIIETQLIFEFFATNIGLPKYGAVYCLSILVLFIVLYSSWKIEEFWRSMRKAERWRYKFLIVGSFLICGVLAWSSSYRLTYMVVYKEHFLLLFTLLCLGWAMMVYDVTNNRLLNRKIFISRKAVYSFVFPTLLAVYFLAFGFISLVMNMFSLEMSFVIKWLLVVTGIVGVMLFGFSGKIRRRAHFFISTHFYTNKYEYRDEWLHLSESLEGAQTEEEVVQALHIILQESLYTAEIFIWLGDSENSQDFKLVSSPGDFKDRDITTIRSGGILVNHLKENSYFYLDEKEQLAEWKEVKDQNRDLMESLQLKIITPISINNHICGLIGLGAEYTGGEYSYDDFDLLSALGSQTAATLLAIRMAEKLAKAREEQAWNKLSAFVLHDIKNAATMLSLLQANAPEHIHEPEFQKDMLELVDDTLKRMKRVEERLIALKDEKTPDLQTVQLKPVLSECIQRMEKRLPHIEFHIESNENLHVFCDPILLNSIMENLLLNASQAQGNRGDVQIKTQMNTMQDSVNIEILDDGPGINESLLPEALFEPFKTTKEGGSGIGLWQVKKLISNMRGTIQAENIPEKGAKFTIQLLSKSSVE